MPPKWVGWTLGAASVMTIILVGVGTVEIAAYGDWGHEYTKPWSGGLLALAVAGVLAACWGPPARMGRVLRVALLLPIVQVAAAFGAIAIWRVASIEMPDLAAITPYLKALPPYWVFVIGGVMTFVLGAIIAGGRRGLWLQATATLSLVQLLFLGVWLPLAIAVHYGHFDSDEMTTVVSNVVASRSFAVAALVPPMIAAVAFTALALHRHELIAKQRAVLVYTGVMVLLAAFCCRCDLTYMTSIMYANFIHVLLAAALIAVCALAALASSLWLAGLRGRRMLAKATRGGTIVDDGRGPVAVLRIAGWLRGTQIAARPFEVMTPNGPIAVPSGISITCDPPAYSAQLATGQELVLLQPGDRVDLAGFVEADPSAPYRGSAGMVPSDAGAWVGTGARGPGGFAAVALATWRPFVAYLLVTVAVMLPALAGLLGD
jgi:hypothetical protein